MKTLKSTQLGIAAAAALVILAAPLTALAVDRSEGGAVPGAATEQAGKTLGVDRIAAMLGEQGYSQIREIEWDDGRYEVEARHPDGQEVDLDVDPQSGRILKVDRHD